MIDNSADSCTQCPYCDEQWGNDPGIQFADVRLHVACYEKLIRELLEPEPDKLSDNEKRHR